MPFILFLSILALDALSKFLAVETLSLHQSLPVIKGIFHLTLVYNRGAAFGILKNQTPFLIFTSLLAIVLIYIYLKDKRKQYPPFFKFALILILAGALGNLADRLLFGYVIDFLDFRIWPVFNLADSSITIGALLLGYAIFKHKV